MGRATRWGAGTSGGGPPPPPGSVKVVPALRLVQAYGVQAHVTFKGTTYYGPSSSDGTMNINDSISRFADMGATYIRGNYVPGHPGTTAALAALRRYGMGWLMTPIPEGNGTDPISIPLSQIDTIVADINTRAADVCLAVEGVNEPNDIRNSTLPVRSDWASAPTDGAAAAQLELWGAVQSSTNLRHIPVVSSSLHDVANDTSYNAAQTLATKAGLALSAIVPRGGVASVGALPTSGRVAGDTWMINGTTNNYTWSGTAWVGPVTSQGGVKHQMQMRMAGSDYLVAFHYAGLHSYPPRGDIPEGGMASRLRYIDLAYGPLTPTWLTEWGYTTAVNNTTSGHAIATPAAAAVYAPRALLQFAGGAGQSAVRDMRVTRYAGLDQPDSTNAVVESNFGVVECAGLSPSTWSNKPEVAAMKALLSQVADPAGTPVYDPGYMNLTVDVGGVGDIQWEVVGNAAGDLLWCGWRNLQVMDIHTKAPIVVPTKPVVLTDGTGTRTVQVAGSVVTAVVSR